eukprot:s2087_g9.t3
MFSISLSGTTPQSYSCLVQRGEFLVVHPHIQGLYYQRSLQSCKGSWLEVQHRVKSSRGSRGSQSSGRSAMDHRPLVERVKGGVKLFVGRLPVETTTDLLSRAFEDFGEVLEVFLIDGRGASGARCAFVRLAHLKDAERAIEEMHEKRVLIHERAELGPIQVAFAKGEATRMGLDASKEQLPARWQVPITAGAPIPATGPVEPESLSKEALVSLIKEGQRSGGQPFKQQWWSYCDQGRGGVADYDPKRHPEKSLRQFFAACQAGEWGAKPWFRRAVNWATMGGKRSRGRRRSSSSSSSRSSRSSSRKRRSRSVSRSGRTRGESKVSQAQSNSNRALRDTERSRPDATKAIGSRSGVAADPPPPPAEEPPPEPDTHPPPKARLLSSAAERDTELEDFLAKNRISPATSFLMLKLTRDQASSVMSSVSEALDKTGASDLARSGRSAAESLVLQKLKGLGVRAQSGGSWTSTERTASPVPPAADRIKKAEAETGSREKEGALALGLDLPSVDGLLGLVDLEIDVEDNKDGKEEDSAAHDGANHSAQTEEQEELHDLKDSARGESVPEQPQEADDTKMTPSSARRQLAGPPGCQVFVKNLDKATGEPELRDLFNKHGTVHDVEMATEEGTSVTKGFAIVLMSSKKEAKQCVKALNFTKPWGRALIVEREEGIQDSPSRSPSPQKKALEEAKPTEKTAEELKRSKSKSRTASHESGWSRYTIEGKGGQRSRGKRRSLRRRQKRSKTKKSSRTRSSRLYPDKSICKLDWRPHPASPGPRAISEPGEGGTAYGLARSSSIYANARQPLKILHEFHGDSDDAAPAMPWGMPMPGMPVAYDAEEAERQLRRAEKAARKEGRRQKGEGNDKTQVGNLSASSFKTLLSQSGKTTLRGHRKSIRPPGLWDLSCDVESLSKVARIPVNIVTLPLSNTVIGSKLPEATCVRAMVGRFRFSSRPRSILLVSALVLAALKAAPWSAPCAVVLEEVAVTPPADSLESLSLKALIRRLARPAANEFWYQQYDTNAVGEAWRGSRHWVDRVGVGQTGEELEQQLASTRIAGRSINDGRRHQMRLARARNLRALEERLASQERQEPRMRQLASRFFDSNALAERWHSAASPSEGHAMEEQLQALEVGRKKATEGFQAFMFWFFQEHAPLAHDAEKGRGLRPASWRNLVFQLSCSRID